MMYKLHLRKKLEQLLSKRQAEILPLRNLKSSRLKLLVPNQVLKDLVDQWKKQ
jgi:hypothetical protein